MADHQASYAKIGFTVFIGAIAIVLTLIYLGGVGNRRDEIILETVYDKSVNGLAVGSPVNFRGVKVGRVSAISFVGCVYPEVEGETDSGRIYIELAFDVAKIGFQPYGRAEVERTVRQIIAKGARASVTSNGITGLSRVEIDYYPDDQTPLTLKWRPHHIYIPPHLSLMDSFSVAATKAVNNINKMDFNLVWTNISRTVESLAIASDSMRVMLEARQGDLDKIVNSVSETAGDLRETAAKLRENPSLLVRELQREPLSETAR